MLKKYKILNLVIKDIDFEGLKNEGDSNIF